MASDNDSRNSSYIKNNRRKCFDDYFDECTPELLAITDLEYKYPFFRLHKPLIRYEVGKKFNLNIGYNLHLKAKRKNPEEYIYSDLNNGDNSLNISIEDDEKNVSMRAQEKMYCDPKNGFNQIKNYFEKNGEILFNDYHIIINEDFLKFDDRDGKHISFRGWTGGYLNSPLEKINYGHLMDKLELDSQKFTEPLEKRINSMKMLFDGIIEGTDFKAEKIDIPRLEMPKYKKIYSNLKNESYYHDITKFSEKVSERLDISQEYDISLIMDGTSKPTLWFKHKQIPEIRFNIEFSEFKDTIGSCGLYVPKILAAKKEFIENKYIIYHNSDKAWNPDEKEIYQNSPYDKMIGTCMYFKDEKDISKSLNECLNSIKGKRLIEIIPGLKNILNDKSRI